MPGDLYNLDSAYGSEAELRDCIRALQGAGMKVLGDAVLNHRCAQRQDEHGVWNLYGGRMAWDQRAIVGEWVCVLRCGVYVCVFVKGRGVAGQRSTCHGAALGCGWQCG
jgi:hypothetical protein